MWILWAFGSALCAGASSVLAKCGIRRTDSTLATALRTVVVLVMAWAVVFLAGAQAGIGSISPAGWGFLVLSGLATGGSWLCYFRALQLGPASAVAPIDKLSKRLIARNIQLLLDYCMRFYERQFVTRSASNKDVLAKFEALLDAYFQDGKPEDEGLPSVRYFAEKVFLSPNYFGDLIKKETGKTAQEHIQNKLIDTAKQMIAGTNKTISQIAYELGFQYSQHFNRVFKRNVGCTPNQYREMQ